MGFILLNSVCTQMLIAFLLLVNPIEFTDARPSLETRCNRHYRKHRQLHNRCDLHRERYVRLHEVCSTHLDNYESLHNSCQAHLAQHQQLHDRCDLLRGNVYDSLDDEDPVRESSDSSETESYPSSRERNEYEYNESSD